MLAAARQVEYDPARNWLKLDVFGADNVWPAPSPEALSLLCALYDPLSLVSPLLQHAPWDHPVLNAYEKLSPQARVELMVFETLLLHELTHRVDYTHSVHGGAYRALTIHQAYSLLQLWPMLLAAHAFVNDVVSKWDPSEVKRAGTEAMEHWHTLIVSDREVLEYFQVLPPHRLSPGWPPGSRDIVRFNLPSGPPLEVATVQFTDGTNDATVLLSSERHPGHYLRPAAVVEGRALCHGIRHLALRFRERPLLGLQEISSYLEWAAPPSLAPDYRFILDVVARYFGAPDLATLIINSHRKGRLDLIDMVAAHAATLSWVAMGGLDIGQRLLFCIALYPDCYMDGREVVSPWVLAEQLEHAINDMAGTLGMRWHGIEASLRDVTGYLRSVPRAPLLPGLEIHSDRMVREITGNLENRMGKGHTCAAGFPPDGNPIAAYQSREDVWDMLDLTNERWAMNGVDSWFHARRDLLGYTAGEVKQRAWESLV
jgi:hypothetical protein